MMLNIQGAARRGFCDGKSRRDFLRIGGLALGGMTLPDILRAEAQNGIRKSHKAVIMMFLPGGPSHQDIFDLKMDAPSEMRGEFKPISTNVPGIQIFEHLPRLAKLMDKCALIRSMADCEPGHDAFQCLTGRSAKQQPPGGWPSFGSAVSKVQGQVDPSVPAFVGLAPKMGHMPWARTGDPGFLGVAHAPFQPNRGGGTQDMSLNGVTLDRLHDRQALLRGFDDFRRDMDASGLMDGIDVFNEHAIGVLTSSKLLDALDLSREDPRIVASYGKGEPRNRDDGGPKLMEHFLAARRLVEAGARVVTLAFSRWDYHCNNFGQLREDLPLLDSGLSALITDIHQRGLDKDVSVVVWGEFGRTPTINQRRARPLAARFLRAARGRRHEDGPGHRRDRQAGRRSHRSSRCVSARCSPRLYHNLGIDVNKTTLTDFAGRPQYLVDGWQPMPELV